MKNITIKFAGHHINVVTYLVTDEFSNGQFVSTEVGMVPLDSKGASVKYQEVAEQVDRILEWDTSSVTFVMKDDSTLKLEMSERMKKQVGRVNTTGVGIVGSYFQVFTRLADPVVTKEEFDAKRKAEKAAAPVSKSAPKRGSKKSAISDDDLDYIMEQIKAKFPNETKFKNKDLAPLVQDRFTARQTPSRLKKLVDMGQLDSDSASPKNYWLA